MSDNSTNTSMSVKQLATASFVVTNVFCVCGKALRAGIRSLTGQVCPCVTPELLASFADLPADPADSLPFAPVHLVEPEDREPYGVPSPDMRVVLQASSLDFDHHLARCIEVDGSSVDYLRTLSAYFTGIYAQSIRDVISLAGRRHDVGSYYNQALVSYRLVDRTLRVYAESRPEDAVFAWFVNIFLVSRRLGCVCSCSGCEFVDNYLRTKGFVTNGFFSGDVGLAKVAIRNLALRKEKCVGYFHLLRGYFGNTCQSFSHLIADKRNIFQTAEFLESREVLTLPAFQFMAFLGSTVRDIVDRAQNPEQAMGYVTRGCPEFKLPPIYSTKIGYSLAEMMNSCSPDKWTSKYTRDYRDFVDVEAHAQGGMMSSMMGAADAMAPLQDPKTSSNVSEAISMLGSVGGFCKWIREAFISVFTWFSDNCKGVVNWCAGTLVFFLARRLLDKFADVIWSASGALVAGLLAAAILMPECMKTAYGDLVGVFKSVADYLSSLTRTEEEEVMDGEIWAKSQIGDPRSYSAIAMILLLSVPKNIRSSEVVKEALRLGPALVGGARIADSGLEYLISIMPQIFVGFFTNIGMYHPFAAFGTDSNLLAEVCGLMKIKEEKGITSDFCFTWNLKWRKFLDAYPGIACRVTGGPGTFIKGIYIQGSEVDHDIQNFTRDEKKILSVGGFFYGDPGIGKSFMVKALSTVLMAGRGLAESDILCSLNTSEKYWSSWHNQRVILIEEFGHGKPEDVKAMCLATLQLISDIPFSPPHAFDKGRAADPDYVFATSNFSYHTDFQGVNRVALRRRFMGFSMHLVGCRDEAGRFDYDQFAKQSPSYRLGFEHLRFHLMGVDEDVVVQKLNFTELVLRFKAAHLLHKLARDQQNVDFHAMRDHFMELERKLDGIEVQVQMDSIGKLGKMLSGSSEDVLKRKLANADILASNENFPPLAPEKVVFSSCVSDVPVTGFEPDFETDDFGAYLASDIPELVPVPDKAVTSEEKYKRDFWVPTEKSISRKAGKRRDGTYQVIAAWEFPPIYRSDYLPETEEKDDPFVPRKSWGRHTFRSAWETFAKIVPANLVIPIYGVDWLKASLPCSKRMAIMAFYALVMSDVMALRYGKEGIRCHVDEVVPWMVVYGQTVMYELSLMSQKLMFCPFMPHLSRALGDWSTKSLYRPIEVVDASLPITSLAFAFKTPSGNISLNRIEPSGEAGVPIRLATKAEITPGHRDCLVVAGKLPMARGRYGIPVGAVELVDLNPDDLTVRPPSVALGIWSPGVVDYLFRLPLQVISDCLAIAGRSVVRVVKAAYHWVTKPLWDYKYVLAAIGGAFAAYKIGRATLDYLLGDAEEPRSQAAANSTDYEGQRFADRFERLARKAQWGTKPNSKVHRKTAHAVSKSTSHHKAMHAQISPEKELEDQVVEQSVLQTRQVLEKISLNMARLTWGRGAGLCGVVLKADKLLCPYHFFRDPIDEDSLLEDGTVFEVAVGKVKRDVVFERKNIESYHRVDEKGQTMYDDWIIYRLGTGFSMPDIERYFADAVDTRLTKAFACYGFLAAGKETHVTFDELKDVGYEADALRYRAFSGQGRNCYIPEQLVYAGRKDGDCGALVIGINPGGHVAILGMHVAERTINRGEPRGIARPIPNTLFAEVGVKVQMHVPMPIGLDFMGSVFPRVPPPHTETSYVRSPIAPEPLFSVVQRAPAHLGYSVDCPFSYNDLIRKELAECSVGAATHPYPQCDVDEVGASITRHFELAWRADFQKSVRVLTLGEGLNGRGDHLDLKPMSLRTSAGWPFCVWPGARGKRHVILGDPGEFYLSPAASVEYEALTVQMGQDLPVGEIPTAKIYLHLKDELRSQKKLTAFKTRIISNLSFLHTLHMRRYFGAFVNFMHGSYNMCFSAVGMNPQSTDWNTMWQYLRQVSDVGFDGDYTKFERYLCAQLADMILGIANEWYRAHGVCTDQDVVVRRNLVYSMLNCWIIVGQDFFAQSGDLKSGVFATTVLFGNLMNMFFLRYAFLICSRKLEPQMANLAFYEKYVRAKGFGDDNISAVNPAVSGFYNQRTVCEALGSIGVVYTPADKEAEIVELKPLEQCSFLQFRTRCDAVDRPPRFPGITHLAVPDFDDRFFACCVWICKNLDPVLATLSNANDILRRSFGHSKRRWNQLRDDLERIFVDLGVPGRLLTWHECYAAFGTENVFDYDVDDPMVPIAWWNTLDTQVNSDLFAKVRPRLLTRVWKRPIEKVIAVRRAGFESSNLQFVSDVRDSYSFDSYGFDFVSVKAQMMSQVDQRENFNEVSSVVTVGVPSTSSAVVRPTYDGSTSIVEFLRRFSVFVRAFIGTETNFFTGDVLLPTPAVSQFARPGHLSYWARLFRYYVGDLVINFEGNQTFDIMYDTAFNGDTAFSNKNLANFGSMGPVAYAAPGGNANLFSFPWVSPYPITSIPRFASESTTDVCSAGEVNFSAAASPSKYLWAAGGDNYRFGYLMEVPQFFLGTAEQFVAKYPDRAGEVGLSVEAHAQMQEGVNFSEVEEKAIGLDNARPSTGPSGDLGEIERPFSVAELSERWQFLHTAKWIVGDPFGTQLAIYNVPFNLLTGVNRIPFTLMQFYRGRVRIKIKLQSQPFQQGMCIAYFVPERDATYVNTFIGSSMVSQSILPNQLILAGGNREVIFEIPWIHHQTQLDASDLTVSQGTFVLAIFNPLVVGALVTQDYATFSLFVSFPDPHFETLVVSAMKEDEDFIEVKAQMNNFPDTARSRAGAVSGGNRTRPVLGVTPSAMILVGAPDVTNIDNVTPAHYMGGCASDSTMVTQTQFSTTTDECRLDNLCGRLSFYRTLRYGVGAAPGDVLFSSELTCCPEIIAAPLLGTVNMMLASYAASVFEFWRADIVFSIQVVSTRGHGGQLICFPNYRSQSGTSSITQSTSAYATVIDVSVPTTVEVVIPWRSTSQMLRVPHNPVMGGSPPLRDRINYSMGVFQICVVNSLQASDTVPDFVYLNVSFALRNFHFSFLSNGLSFRTLLDPYFALGKARKSGIARQKPDTPEESKESTSLGKPGGGSAAAA